jgi:hypothetical protein
MIKKWLRNWLLNKDKEDKEQRYASSGISIGRSSFDSDDHRVNTLRFNVTPARGGVVLTVKNYDRKRDEDNVTVHVLHDGQDLAKDIGDIVSMELLRA